MNYKFNPEIHHRRSIRLKDYDYSQEGFYFITLCTGNREHLFGEINDGTMVLNEIGMLIKEEWEKTTEIRKNIALGEYIIMPNHFHAIIQIEHQIKSQTYTTMGLKSTSQTIGSIIRGFKGTTTLKINLIQPVRKECRGVLPYAQNVKSSKQDNSIWQRNYWERIIRNQKEFNQISQYIINNPALWEDDKLNGGEGNTVLEKGEGYNQQEWMV
ncbi:MAG: transposase [Candidatus Cloacimonadales bacterium]